MLCVTVTAPSLAAPAEPGRHCAAYNPSAATRSTPAPSSFSVCGASPLLNVRNPAAPMPRSQPENSAALTRVSSPKYTVKPDVRPIRTERPEQLDERAL